ncbi:MAG: AAA family ATPase [Candidatus Humimicrobiaceae bacterium]
MKNILIISENGSLAAELENTGFFGDVKTSLSFTGKKLNSIDILIVDSLTISYDQYLKNFSNFLNQVKSNYYIAKDLDTYSTINKNLSGYGIIVLPPLLSDTQITKKICSLAVENFTVKKSIVCFFGAGPGVGTTMISQSVAQVMSDLIGKSIIFLALDGSYGTTYFDIDLNSGGLAEIKERLINNILSTDELKNSCLKINSLYVLPGENDISKVRHYHPEYIEKLIDLSLRAFDVTIINAGSAITGMSIGALNSSKLKYLITTQSYKYFRNFKKLINQVFVNLGINTDDFSLIANKYIEASDLEDEISLSKNYGMPLASVIPLIDYTTSLEAENKGKTLVGYEAIFESSIRQLSVFLCKELGIEIKDRKIVKDSFFKRILKKGLREK